MKLEMPDNLLDRVCEAHYAGGDSDPMVRFHVRHDHDAINYTLAGVVVADDGTEYGFRIRDGNNDGTVVEEFGPADDVDCYGDVEPPDPEDLPTFIPARNDLPDGMLAAYRAWRKTTWFKEKERGYRYDRHFAPGEATERHYREWAAKKGMRIGCLRDVQREGVEPLSKEPMGG